MTMLTVDEVLGSPEAGTYSVLRHPGGVLELVNYGERWAYGYIVGVKTLEMSDIRPGNLIGVWRDESGEKVFDVVKHVDALQDAVRLGNDHDQVAIWDLRENKEVWL